MVIYEDISGVTGYQAKMINQLSDWQEMNLQLLNHYFKQKHQTLTNFHSSLFSITVIETKRHQIENVLGRLR